MSKNIKTVLTIFSVLISMSLLTAASVPIYNLFCKATGFGGTTKYVETFQNLSKGSKKIRVRFDANIDKNLSWRFVPKHLFADVLPGENTLIFYESENISDNDIIGTAVYNVTPMKAGKYFVKIHCFCFEEQLLKAKEKAIMPVSFYIDPDIEKDKDMKDVHTITLSYSFYKVRDFSF